MLRGLALPMVAVAAVLMLTPGAATVPDGAWSATAKDCTTAASFFLVEYHQADRFLPPGFHPRDLAEFIYYTPATSGKVPAFVAISRCQSADFTGPAPSAGALSITYVGFFVEPPVLAGSHAIPPADFDFYAVGFMGPGAGDEAAPFRATQPLGWQHEPADMRLDVVSGPSADGPLASEGLGASAVGSVTQGGQQVFHFDARGLVPQTFPSPPTLRFWHQGSAGIGWLEFDLPMRTVPAGPLGACELAAGSLPAQVVGHEGGDAVCGPLNSFALVFDRHDLRGEIRHFAGVAAAPQTELPARPVPPTDGASLRVLAPLDVAQALTIDIAAEQGTMCNDGAETSAPLSGWERYADPFLRVEGPTPLLRFRDDYQENGCGEARFAVSVPEDATRMTLTMQVDRKVESQTRTATPRAFQTVRMYALDGPLGSDLSPLPCVDDHEVFPTTWPSTLAPQPVTVHVDLTRCGLAGHDVAIGFRFMDGGPAVDADRDVPEGLPAGQLFRATVYAPHVVFDGIHLPVAQARVDGLDPGRSALGYLTHAVEVPEPAAGQGHETSFALSNEHGILGLYKRTDDGLQRLPDRLIEAQEVEGQLVFTIGSSVVEQEGAGVYEVLFTAPDTSRVSLLRLPLVGVAMLLPLVAGAVAQRNLHAVHQLGPGHRRQRYALQGAVALCWLAYLGLALFLFLADAGIGMAAWPVPLPNLLAYIALAAIAAGMVAVAVAARRLELVIVRRDLSALELAQRELERSNRELEQFAYVASHDLKEPLRIVAGYTQLLRLRYGARLDDKGQVFLDHATEGARRLQRMVDDLLAYSRVRADPSGWRPVSLDDAMEAVKMHLRGLIEERQVRLRCSPLPTVVAERGQVVQLLLNLVQNAIKFSPQDRPVIEVGADEQDGIVRVFVRDEGIGIDARQQQRIFQIFQRLHLREEYDGNGIGLAVCRKIVEQFGGRIWVESEPGRGSTFLFTLTQHAPEAGRSTAAAAARRRRRVGQGAEAAGP